MITKSAVFFLIFLFFPFVLFAQKDPCKNLESFDQDQLKTIAYAYNYGKKHDFGYTMAAIAWQESCAGRYRINFSDPSAGIYHAHLPGVIKRHYKQKDTEFRRNVVAERLIREPDFASQIALEELMYWEKVRKGNWKEIIKSYNKGYSWEKSKERNKIAETYFEEVNDKVKELKKFFSQNPRLLKQNKPPKAQNSPKTQSSSNSSGSFILLRERN